MRPVEVPDDEHELVIERVCAIDVAKVSGKVCLRVPHPSRDGRRISRMWHAEATAGAVTELADHLVGVGIEKVTVESHLDGWRSRFCLLESRASGAIGQCAARSRTSRTAQAKLDSVWLTKLTENGLLTNQVFRSSGDRWRMRRER